MRRPRPEAALVDWVDVSFIGFILFVVGALFTAHAVQHGNDPPTDTMLTGIVLILIGLVRSLFCRDTGDHARAHAPVEADDGR
jgi:uncharacterized membrane protein HdeD (DUF308 family)